MRKGHIGILLALAFLSGCNNKDNGNELELDRQDGMFTYFANDNVSEADIYDSDSADVNDALDDDSDEVYDGLDDDSDEDYDRLGDDDSDEDYDGLGDDYVDEVYDELENDSKSDNVDEEYNNWFDEDEQTTLVSEVEYNVYYNEEMSYAFIYPTNFDVVDDSCNGMGVIFEDDNEAVLDIFGAYNVSGMDTENMLLQYTDMFDDIEYSFAGDNYWCYSRTTQDDTIQYSAGYIDMDYEVSFMLEYSKDNKDEYADTINALMEHLLNGNVF